MKILGIETSCDETGVCLIEASGDISTDFKFEILGNALYSQVAIHAPYGGVFPNLAKREHAKNLIPLLHSTLQQGHLLAKGLTFNGAQIQEILNREPELLEQLTEFLTKYDKPEIDAIAVTYGPGLEPALWVGVNLARALSLAWDVPLVAVNHMEGHIMMSAMRDGELADFQFPLLSLLISGGHTELVLSREWMQYEVIGQTRDDAVGEAFDKVARLLGLPYPGGPEISRLAGKARIQNADAQIKFTPPMLHSKDFDFSFSGLKTEVRKFVEGKDLDGTMKMQIARAFEDAVAQVLVRKTLAAVDEFGVATVIVGGGVSANTFIRAELAKALEKSSGIQLLVPPPDLATDNALMIALAGYFHAIKGDFADPGTLRAEGNLKLR
jgi:N6-L-threonylcarbamoyladenine synthase